MRREAAPYFTRENSFPSIDFTPWIIEEEI
jgi:hypothetical protein